MIIVVAGPTGVGKTRLSVELAKRYNAEVINADSMQVYKELNIGTAKVTEKEKENVPHHLFDIKNPDELYTVYDYQKDLRNILDNNKNKNYIIAPSILREQIQDKQDKIYANDTESSNELDYRFYLDKATLSKIRNYTKTKANGKYTTFNGTFEVINGVSVYKSNLFRGTGSEIDSKYIKKLGLLGCNNQANSNQCDNYAQAIGG